MKKIMLAFTVAIICMAFEARAEEMIKVSNQKYTRGDIIADFLNIAFSEYFWNEDANPSWSARSGLARSINAWPRFASTNRDNSGLPWIDYHLYHPDGLPRHNVINKWDGEITIGIGWPAYYADHRPIGDNTLLGREIARMQRVGFDTIVEQKVDEFRPVLEKRTGLKVQFISPSDPREITEAYARIRIILQNNWDTGFPVQFKDYTGYPFNVHEYELELWTGVQFQFSTQGPMKSPMDGYMLPTPANTPNTVICKIDSDFSQPVIKAFIAECLIKAMGLPDTSNLMHDSLVSPWTGAYRAGSTIDEAAVLATETKKFTASFTSYDERMLGLLYCPAIKPGMDKNQVLQILMSNDECVSKYLSGEY